MTIAAPIPPNAQQFVEIAARADINASRRIDQDEEFRLLIERPGEQDLLLIAAAQALHLEFRRRRSA